MKNDFNRHVGAGGYSGKVTGNNNAVVFWVETREWGFSFEGACTIVVHRE